MSQKRKSKPSLKWFRVITGYPNWNQTIWFHGKNLQTRTKTTGLVSVQTKFGSVWNQTSPTLVAVNHLKAQITKQYEVTDLGEIESYLGIRILRDHSNKCLTIDQSGYVKDILDHFGMADMNPNHTPLPSGTDVHLIKYNGQATQSDIKALSAACSMYRSACAQIYHLLCLD